MRKRKGEKSGFSSKLLHLQGKKGRAPQAEEREKERGTKKENKERLTLQHARVLADRGPADARVAFHLEVVSKSAHDLFDLLRELARRGQDEGLALEEGVVEVLEDA